jgi:hypothetical protein
MADDEDSTDEAPFAELAAWVHRHLGNTPDPMPPDMAAALFIADMECARTAFREHDRIGCVAALLAGLRACNSLGRPDLSDPFRTLFSALRDVAEGKPPPVVLRRGPPAEGAPKDSDLWSFRASICSFLDALIKETKMPRESAARAVAAIVDKSAKNIGKSKLQTWQSNLSIREKLDEGSCPEAARAEYRTLKEGLAVDLLHLPPGADRRMALLNRLRGHLGL